MLKINQRIAFKSISGSVFLLAIFSVIVCVIGYNSYTASLMKTYSDGAFQTAEQAAAIVNGNRVPQYAASGGEGAVYHYTWNQLDKLCNMTGSTFIYVIIPDRTDYAHIEFIFSTMNKESSFSQYEFGYVRDTTNDEYRMKYRAICEEGSERELVIRDKGYIETDPHITAMIPLKDLSGEVQAILCVQRQMDVLADVRRLFVRTVVAAMVILAVLVSIVQALFLNSEFLGPLKKISEEALRFSKENTPPDKTLRESIRNHDEIGELASSIDKMEEQIEDYIENLTVVTAEKERIKTELGLAAQIQESMLPDIFPAFPDRLEFDIYASSNLAREVGGDFYDFFLIDEDHFCIVMADVSGKGIPAALFMMASKIVLANNAISGKSPAQILTDTNTSVCVNNRMEMFVTVWLGILEISTGILTAANAGHEYPAVMEKEGKFELIKDPHGFVIGGMDGVKYKEYQMKLKPGSKLFLYTDGLPEATNANNDMYGKDRMITALNINRNESPQEILKTVLSSVNGFVKDAEQFDDLTMLCIEYRGADGAGTGTSGEN